MKLLALILLALVLLDVQLVDRLEGTPSIALIPWHEDKSSKAPRLLLKVSAYSYSKGNPRLISRPSMSTKHIAVYEFITDDNKEDYIQRVDASIKVELTSDLNQIVIIANKEWFILRIPRIQAVGSVVDWVDEYRPLKQK